MRRPSRTGLSLAFALCASIPSTAQDLHAIGSEKPFSIAASLSFNQIFYASRGISARRDPYTYFASGSANLSLYGWTVPLTFSVSNGNTTFSQPFNQYSLHPAWKWITAHAGYTSMSFSSYTVNGHIFLGGGIELTPEANWKLSALYGRFLKAAEADSDAIAPALPTFQRSGYGLKATWGTGRNFIDMIVFRAEDSKNSILPPPDSLGVTPHENLVVSIGGGKTLFKKLLLKAELAASAITRDTRAGKTTHDHPLAKAGSFFQPRRSSAYYHAFKTSLDYQQEGWLIGLSYERIDPEYQTLGAYYFNNDLENITVNASAGLMNGKMNVAVSAGVQHDNLQKTKVSSMQRMVGSFNASFTPSQRLNVSASWSSFQAYTTIRPQFRNINQLTLYDNLDTLNFMQISRNATLSAMITLPGEETVRKGIQCNLTWQAAADKQGRNDDSGASFYNLNAGYSLSLVPTHMTLSITFNATINESPGMQSRMLGPTASLSKSFFSRKLRTTLSSSWNTSANNGRKIHTVANARMNTSLSIHKQHNVSLSAVIMKRAVAGDAAGRSYTEFTATLGYSYRIGMGK